MASPVAEIGRLCAGIASGLGRYDPTADCAECCACLRYARVGMVPSPTNMMMRCASGARKLLKVQPLVVSGVGNSWPLVVYLFGDAVEESPTGTLRWERGQAGASGPLTAREVEVLRYLALGWDVAHIAAEMGLSPHAVRNHSTNLRRKLDVRSSLEAVMAGLPLAWLFGVWAPAVPCGIPAIAAISRSNANAVAASAACLDWFLMLLSLFIMFRIRFVPLVFLTLGR